MIGIIRGTDKNINTHPDTSRKAVGTLCIYVFGNAFARNIDTDSASELKSLSGEGGS